MKNFESWFEKKVTRGRDEYWELEEDLCKTTWRAALEWVCKQAEDTQDDYCCLHQTVMEELGGE